MICTRNKSLSHLLTDVRWRIWRQLQSGGKRGARVAPVIAGHHRLSCLRFWLKFHTGAVVFAGAGALVRESNRK